MGAGEHTAASSVNAAWQSRWPAQSCSSQCLGTICLQGRKHTAAFFVRATRALAARQHNYEALEQRKQQLSKFLTSKSKTMQRLSSTGRRGQGDTGASPGAGGLGWAGLRLPAQSSEPHVGHCLAPISGLRAAGQMWC